MLPNWSVVSSFENTSLYSVCVEVLSAGAEVHCLCDCVSDNRETLQIVDRLDTLCSQYANLTIHTCPGFETSLLKAVPYCLCRDYYTVKSFIGNIGHWEAVPELLTYAQKSLTGYAGKSSEWFGAQLMLKLVEQCAGVSKADLGDYWTCDCPGSACACRWDMVELLSDKYVNYLCVNNFTFTTETSGLVTRSMIDNYG